MSKRRIGITGAAGFIGRHLLARVRRQQDWEAVVCARENFSDPALMQEFVSGCDVIVHLAGMNRGSEDQIEAVNRQLAEAIADAVVQAAVPPAVIYASSIQRDLDNVYGRAKHLAGQILRQSAERKQAHFVELAIPNVYGPGCRPFYNSVVATFCHLIGQGQSPEIHVDNLIEFIFVGELVNVIAGHIQSAVAGTPDSSDVEYISGTAQLKISQLREILQEFADSELIHGVVPDLSDPTRRNLYVTLLSYLPAERWCYTPQLHTDDRGSLVEVIKLAQAGQIFFSTTKPGVIRGEHYHTRKVEWFCVLKGDAVIRLRNVSTHETQEFHVCGDKPQFISIPVMYTHHIENVGETELLTMFWCNEHFNSADADTYYEKVA